MSNQIKEINPKDFSYVQWVGSKQPQKVNSPSHAMVAYTNPGKLYNSYGWSNENSDRVLYVHNKDIALRPNFFRKLTKTEEDNFLKYNFINPTKAQKENFEKYGICNLREKEKIKLDAKKKVNFIKTETTEVKKRGRKPINKQG